MTPVVASSERPEAPLFLDGVGDRILANDGATGEPLQILRVRPALTAVPSFEFALRERTARLANFRHASYVRVRRIDRAMAPTPSLAVVSDHVEGIRLSEILRIAHEKRLQLDFNAALCLVRQLVPAVALLHENARDVGHGLLSPERMIVTPHARLLIVEHVLGAAVEQLHWSRERLWREFRVCVPRTPGVPRLDHRADVVGIGAVALSLFLGRPLRDNEFPDQIPGLLESAREVSATDDARPLSPGLRSWLARALQLDQRRAFASAPEALAGLDEVLGDDFAYVAAPVALETFLSRYVAALAHQPPPPEPVAPPVPPPSAMVPAAPPPSLPPALPPAPPTAALPPARPPAPPAAALPPARPPAPSAAALPPARPVSDFVDLTDLALETGAGTRPQKNLFDPDAPFTAMNAPQAPPPAASPAEPRRGGFGLVAVLAMLLVLGGGGYAFYAMQGSSGASPEPGTLAVRSNPLGVAVFVDGIERGVTPTRVSLPPGAHILELRAEGSTPRVIPLTITSGAEVTQYLELTATPETGELAVQSDPPGARVFVDGTERGVAPITIKDLAPGDHEVMLQRDNATAKHTVAITAGATASLVAPVAPPAPAGPVSGWLDVRAPFTVDIREGGRIVGSSESDRVMFAAGVHDLEFINEALNLSIRRRINITAGKTARLSLELPNGRVDVNASPWAEVWIDGVRRGDTPLANLSVPVGPHEIVFRHPNFGERKRAITVTVGQPVRLSVDMKQQ